MRIQKKLYEKTDVSYNTSDGCGFFRFNIVKTGKIYEIDIIETPKYLNESISPIDTHQSISGRGGYKICFGDPSVVTNFEKAIAFSSEWAELVWKYIRTDEKF